MSLINRYELIYIMQSMWSVPVVNQVSGTDHLSLACPARFERATYALEEFVAAGISISFNWLQHKNGTV
jgi:hypothetical protein